MLNIEAGRDRGGRPVSHQLSAVVIGWTGPEQGIVGDFPEMAVRITEIAVIAAPVGAGRSFDQLGARFDRRLDELIDCLFG